MKKRALILIISFLSIICVNAQGNVKFGVTGGLINGSGNVSVAGIDLGDILRSFDVDIFNGTGFFIGGLIDIEASENFYVQPEVLYASIGGEGAIIIPVMAKYYVAESFNLQAGPQLDYILNVPDLVEPVVNEFGFSLGIGAGYDINDNIAVQAKYAFGLTDRLDNNLDGLLSTSLKINTFQAGVVYKFN